MSGVGEVGGLSVEGYWRSSGRWGGRSMGWLEGGGV